MLSLSGLICILLFLCSSVYRDIFSLMLLLGCLLFSHPLSCFGRNTVHSLSPGMYPWNVPWFIGESCKMQMIGLHIITEHDIVNR